MRTILLRSAIISTLSLAILFAVGWYLSGLSGEIFLVDASGSVHPSPGATVEVYSNRTSSGYLLSDDSGNNKFLARLDKLTMALTEEKQGVPEEKLNLALSLLMQSHCEQMSNGRNHYFGTHVESLASDRDGHFSLRLRPFEDYVIFAEGQAGSHHAIWIEDVHLGWRSDIRLIKAQCEYEVP